MLRPQPPAPEDYLGTTLKDALKSFEHDLIVRTLSESSSNRQAAEKLGIDEGNFSKKLKDLGLR